MRQSSLKQLLSVSLTTTLILGLGFQASVQAEEKGSYWNPMNWFSDSSQKQAQTEEGRARLIEARKRAEEAQRKAEAALMQAAEAQKEAEMARKQADAEMEKANAARKKPTVTIHPEPKRAERAEIIAAPAIEESDPTESDPSESNRAKIERTPQTSAPKAEKDNGFFQADSWNPVNWFKGSEEQKTASTIKQPEKQEALKPEKPRKSDPFVSGNDVKSKAAVIETQKGNIVIELYPEAAPQTVANFAKLVESGFYNKFNMKFHRVIPDFVIQTGDPSGTGAGGSGERIPLEVDNKLSHGAKGMVAMARGPDPNSATSQFYITLAPQASLDGKYAVFGHVIAGMDVLGKIEKQDMLYGIRLVDINSVARDAEPEKKGFFSKVF